MKPQRFGKTLLLAITIVVFLSDVNVLAMYDPGIGRFTSRDPVRGKFEEPLTLHRYLYCQNEPVANTDPSGEFLTAGGLQIVDATLIAHDIYALGLGIAAEGVKNESLDTVVVGGAIAELAFPVGMLVGMAMGTPAEARELAAEGVEARAARKTQGAVCFTARRKAA
jgi:hypothetical protein